MEIKTFLQGLISFVTFMLSILVFELLDLDMTFIVTFILAILSIGIAIYFFIETNKLFSQIKDKLFEIEYKLPPGLRNIQNKADRPIGFINLDDFKKREKEGKK